MTKRASPAWTISKEGLSLCFNGREVASIGRITPMSSKATEELANKIAASLNATGTTI